MGRKHWRRYATGILIETLFILGLTLIAVVFAVITTLVLR